MDQFPLIIILQVLTIRKYRRVATIKIEPENGKYSLDK